MKIKKNIEAARELEPVIDEVREGQEPVMGDEDNSNKYDEAISFIQSAINSLARLDSSDRIARDSITNLAVVMLDLRR